MLERINQCPICNSSSLDEHIVCKDHMLTGESFIISKCARCSFLLTNPRPDSANLSKYYDSDKYVSHTNKANNLLNTTYKIARYFTLKKKLNLLTSITNQKSILDYGCGTGELLSLCSKKGWKISGYEPDESANQKATALTKTRISSSQTELQNSEPTSLITLWHVLEHISDLNDTFALLKSKLKEQGKFVIAVPNHKSYDALYYKEYWAAYDIPRHLYHFSIETMTQFLKNHGLKIYRTIPMKLDSYYVSLLSEKYKNGKSNYLKSFINGYKSNSLAQKNNNNYSSIIYIAGK